MRSLKSGLVGFAFSGLFGLAAMIGCSADGGSVDIEEPTTAQDPTEGTAMLPPTGGATLPPSDAGAKDAGKKDAGKSDAGVDAAPPPPPPTPGTACTTVDAIAQKPCGKCGVASAVCLSDNKWSEYGACENEAGECTPGESAACGNCGTQTCTQYCSWSACGGEPANSCSPGTVEMSTVGCPPQGNVKPYRTRECKADCSWQSYSTTCFTPPSWAPVTLELTAGQKMNRTSFFSCPATISTTSTSYVYHQVTNPTSAPVKVKIYHSAAAGGPASLDTILAVYAGATNPATDDERKACLHIGDQSGSDTALTGDSDWAIVKGVTIPAAGTITVYSAGYSASEVGTFVLNVAAE